MESVGAENTSNIAGSVNRDYVDSPLPEYQPLLPSTHQEDKKKTFKRKQSTFIVTPISLLEKDDFEANQHPLVSTFKTWTFN